MAYKNALPMNRLLDGVIAGFKVTERKAFQTDIEIQDANTGMIKSVKWTKIQVSLTHAMDIPSSIPKPYAVENVDPSSPLVLKLHTFLIPQPAIDGVPQRPISADKAPSSDTMRWAFIKYDTLAKILKLGGYVTRSNPPQKFPLPGVVYIELALSKGNNYPKRIGGPEIIDEKRKENEEISNCLDSIVDAADGGDSSNTDEVDAQLDLMQEEHEIVKEETKAKTKAKSKKDKKD